MQQFSHHGDNGLHRLFAGGDEFVIKGFDLGLTTNGHQGGHIQCGAQILIPGLGDASRWMDGVARLIGPRIQSGLRHPLGCFHIGG